MVLDSERKGTGTLIRAVQGGTHGAAAVMEASALIKETRAVVKALRERGA